MLIKLHLNRPYAEYHILQTNNLWRHSPPLSRRRAARFFISRVVSLLRKFRQRTLSATTAGNRPLPRASAPAKAVILKFNRQADDCLKSDIELVYANRRCYRARSGAFALARRMSQLLATYCRRGQGSVWPVLGGACFGMFSRLLPAMRTRCKSVCSSRWHLPELPRRTYAF